MDYDRKIILDLPQFTLNQYIKAERGNKYKASKIKKNETNKIAWQLATQDPIETPVKLGFVWYTKDRRTDCDNISFMKKFIQDGMVHARVIQDDSQKYIRGYKFEEFKVDKGNPRVEVIFYKVDETKKRKKQKYVNIPKGVK